MPGNYRVKAKRTSYRGRSYRSKTEAEWARWLYRNAFEVEYEHKTAGVYYLPDFYLVGAAFVEVKPPRWIGYPKLPREWEEKAMTLVARTGLPLFMVLGSPTEMIDLVYLAPGRLPDVRSATTSKLSKDLRALVRSRGT